MYLTTNKSNSTDALNNNTLHRVSFFQPKLSINQPNDVYEQEADATSEKIMRMETSPAHVKINNTFFAPSLTAKDNISKGKI